jgi:hypothetical protein
MQYQEGYGPQASWIDGPSHKPRPSKTFLAVEKDGVTIATGDSRESLAALARSIQGNLVSVTTDEQSLCEEARKRRDYKRVGCFTVHEVR